MLREHNLHWTDVLSDLLPHVPSVDVILAKHIADVDDIAELCPHLDGGADAPDRESHHVAGVVLRIDI